MIDFLVVGLPRSGTTWLANWLTTDNSICLHEPFKTLTPEMLAARVRGSHKYFGVSCTAAYMMPWYEQQDPRTTAIIVRNSEDCDESLDDLGLPTTASIAGMRDAFALAAGRRFQFEALWTVSGARELWEYLMPAVIRFDEERYLLLRDMQIQPDFSRYKVDLELVAGMMRSGAMPVGILPK